MLGESRGSFESWCRPSILTSRASGSCVAASLAARRVVQALRSEVACDECWFASWKLTPLIDRAILRHKYSKKWNRSVWTIR